MHSIASLRKERTVAKEKERVVPPVPTKKGIEQRYFFRIMFRETETTATSASFSRCVLVNAFKPGKARITRISTGKITIYRSCVYMARLANNRLRMTACCLSRTGRSFPARALRIKNRDRKKKVSARPSSAPPLNNCEILKKENRESLMITPKKRDNQRDLRNRFTIRAKMNVLMVWIPILNK